MRIVAAGILSAVLVGRIGAQAASANSVIDTRGRYPVSHVSGEPPRWGLDSLTTLRDPKGGGFRGLRSILLDPDGTVWVADYATKAIHHFAATGQYLGTLGRTGTTLPPFGMLGGLGWAGADLLVDDPGMGRVTEWTRGGVQRMQWPTSRLRGGDDLRFYQGDGSSAWLFQALPRGDGRTSVAFTRIPPAGQVDTIVVPPLRPFAAVATATCRVSGGERTFVSPFGPAYRVVPTGGGRIVVLDEVEYRLIILSPGGDTTNVVERPMPRAPVTDAEWSAETADYARTRAASRACSGELVRAAEKPAARALLMDDRGRFWVERVVPGGTTWDVWEQLNLVGSVAGPRRATDVAADVRGDRLAIAREGQDGSYSVVVFRIVPR